MARLYKQSPYRTCRVVNDTWTRCEFGCTVCNRRVALLGASADLSGLWSRDQMASARIRDGPLNGELADTYATSRLFA